MREEEGGYRRVHLGLLTMAACVRTTECVLRGKNSFLGDANTEEAILASLCFSLSRNKEADKNECLNYLSDSSALLTLLFLLVVGEAEADILLSRMMDWRHGQAGAAGAAVFQADAGRGRGVAAHRGAFLVLRGIAEGEVFRAGARRAQREGCSIGRGRDLLLDGRGKGGRRCS